jgi:hypothetical protein
MRSFQLLLLFVFCAITLFSQKKNAQLEYHIHRANGPIKVDGKADDAAWQGADLATAFHMVLPMDTSRAQVRTEVRMLYDDQNMYLIAVNYDKLPGPYMVESLRRDFNFGRNDNFLLFLDPFDDQTNGFTFGSNAEGAQWDGQLFDGGSANLSWDNKWISAVSNDDDVWIFEMAVPFKTLRYKPGITRWGGNFSRLDLKTTEKSAWAPVPRQFPTASLAYAGTLVWDEAPPPAGLNVSLIPYLLSGVSKDYAKKTDSKWNADFGGDAKIAVTSALNLDLTINPDFSQVEVDQQQTNLDRFELFFPERRQFFIENGDLFTNFGTRTVRPFFSRRIGLNAPIRYGARLSGKLDKNWRIGLMDMQTGADGQGTPGQNFAVLALQRQLFARSNISLLAINKQTSDYEQVQDPKKINRYNRNLGLEYNLLSKDNIWRGKLMYLKSFTPNIDDKDQSLVASIQHNAKNWTYGLGYENVGQNYRAEVGFVPRVNYQNFNTNLGYLFFPKSKTILSHGPGFEHFNFFTPDGQQTDYEYFMSYRINLRNRTDFFFFGGQDYVKLLRPFDPTNFGVDTLARGTDHTWNFYGFNIQSKPQSVFTYNANVRLGGFYGEGNRTRISGEIGYRWQPYAAITMRVDYNHLDFGEAAVLPAKLRNKNYDFWLVGPRIDLTLSNKLFITNFIQYNNQIKNVNLNLRFQWRYSPASDFFIVYTDNYLSDNLKIRNRALVAKLTFWWNG